MENNTSEIKITINNQNDIKVIETSGRLVYQTTQEAKEQLKDLNENKNGYIMDMRNLERIDSTGFGLVLSVIKRIPRDKKLVVVVSDEFIKELFYITKVNTLVDITDNMENGFELIRKNMEK